MKPVVELSICCHGSFAIELQDASEKLHSFLRSMVLCNWMNDERYKIKNDAGAFIQGGCNNTSGWILIEFWKADGAEAFVDYVNQNYIP